MIRKYSQVKFSIKLTVISLFLLLSLLIISVALTLQYYSSRSLAKDYADTIFKLSAQSVSDKINSLDVESSDLALLLSQYDELKQPDTEKTIRPITKILAQAMLQKPYLFAIYIGFENGNFYEVVNLDSSKKLRQTLNARQSDRWVITHIYNKPGGGRIRTFYFCDSSFEQTHEFRITHTRTETSQYFANVRPWYRQAMNSNSPIKTRPYIFHNTQTPGTTYAKRISDSNNVIAVDISLETLSDYLKQHRTLNSHSFQDANILIFDKTGKLYAHSYDQQTNAKPSSVNKVELTQQEKQYISDLGVLRVSNEKNWPPFDFSYSGIPQGYSIDLFNLLAKKLGIKIEYSNGYNWNELVDLFKTNKLDILHSVFKTKEREQWGLFSEPYLKLLPVIVTQNSNQHINLYGTLEKLNHDKTVAVPTGWAFVDFLKQHYKKINVLEVNDTLSALNAVSNHTADAAFDNKSVVNYFVDRYSLKGLNLNSESTPKTDLIDQQLRFLVHSDKVELRNLLDKALHSLTEPELEALANKWLHTNTQSELQKSISSGVVPNTAFIDLAISGQKKKNILIGETEYSIYVHHSVSKIGPDSYIGILIPTEALQHPYLAQVKTSSKISLGLLILLMPIVLLFAKTIVTPVNLLAGENKKIMKRKFNEVQSVPSRIREVDDLSNSMLSMASSIEEYQKKQEDLVEVFVKLIAQEIDDKSPYTGAHCERVPEIAIMLAESASKSALPAFKDFKMETKAQWREFKIAAWLHDCGKVTTPEHIIDKGTKLETIYNRIHEIRTRFEVLWRDAEIDYWKAIADGKSQETSQQNLEKRHKEIIDDFAFIAKCNIGTESLDREKIHRIEHIAQQTWIRHLDNRIGLSPLELKHLKSIPAASLPTTENLLIDAQEHIIPWMRNPKAQMKNDFSILVPDNQSNLGEIYNLSIDKGTLTKEERYQINEHIISTIRILEALPLPEELSRVPEIAGGHHEKLNGTGYPRRLTENELSIEARILAVSDIFEALTADDRPYKHAKTLSEAIDILATMVEEKHLDGNIFKLLLTDKIYEQYAQRFLNEAQVDEVDIKKYV